MDRAVEDVDEGDHDDALDDLLVARIAVATMYRSAKTQAQTDIYTASNKFLKSTLQGESAYFEKMALDAGDDRTRIIAYRSQKLLARGYIMQPPPLTISTLLKPRPSPSMSTARLLRILHRFRTST
jgi:hypothetical protein